MTPHHHPKGQSTPGIRRPIQNLRLLQPHLRLRQPMVRPTNGWPSAHGLLYPNQLLASLIQATGGPTSPWAPSLLPFGGTSAPPRLIPTWDPFLPPAAFPIGIHFASCKAASVLTKCPSLFFDNSCSPKFGQGDKKLSVKNAQRFSDEPLLLSEPS